MTEAGVGSGDGDVPMGEGGKSIEYAQVIKDVDRLCSASVGLRNRV